MHVEPPSNGLDLLVVGGLTVDRFADGSTKPGGSVLHIARATARRGLRVGVMTSAGPEPAAEEGLDELRHLAEPVHVTRYPATTTFVHRETPTGRQLRLEQMGGPVRLEPELLARLRPRRVLYAPVATEIDAGSLAAEGGFAVRGAILQGWLRSSIVAADVVALPLNALSHPTLAALAALDVVVASREDLLAEAPTPEQQLRALRGVLGAGPALVVTDGTDGLWIDDNDSVDHLSPPWLVDGVPTVGAGDVLAAFVMVAVAISGDWRAGVAAAMGVVAEELDARRRD